MGFRRSRWFDRTLCAAVVPALLAATTLAQARPQPQSAPADQKAKQASPKELETIVVTAQRRAQNLQDVPVATTALDNVELERRGITNVADLSSVAPNLNVVRTPGDATAAQIAIRGSVTINPALYWEPTVGMYVDGVYVGKVQGSVFDLLDLQRVEVLRGPQGTLYGRNTLAGAINFVTHEPSGTFNGRASLDLGNYGARVGKVNMDLPAIGKLKASVGAMSDQRDGWVDTTPGSSVSQLNNHHSNAAFIRLLYDATDNLSFDYRYDHTDVDQAARYGQVIRSDVQQVFGIPGIDPQQGRVTTAGVDSPTFERLKIDGHALTANWKLGAAGTLKYILSHRIMRWDDALDLDGTALAFATTQRLSDYKQTSNELQWLGQAGAFDWVAGLYRFNDHGYTSNPQHFFFGAVNFDSQYGFATTSDAVYGQVDYKATDRLTFTAGLRRTSEDKSTYRFESGPGGVVLVPQGTQAKASFSATTPMLSASFKFSPEVMAYARYAEGFKSGGFNGEAQTPLSAITPFRPEKMQSFEVGVKTMLFDRRLRLDSAVFHNRNTDMQESVFTAQGATGTDILNAGRAHTEGLELEAEALITPDFKLRADYGYLHEKYDQFIDGGVDVANNRAVVHAPRHTLSLTADATLARTSIGVLRGLLDFNFTSAYYLYPYQLTLVDPMAQLAANTRVRANGTLNARISLEGMDWGGGVEGEIAFWVRNATNRAHLDNILDFGPGFGNLTLGYYNDPRTFGVSVIGRW